MYSGSACREPSTGPLTEGEDVSKHQRGEASNNRGSSFNGRKASSTADTDPFPFTHLIVQGAYSGRLRVSVRNCAWCWGWFNLTASSSGLRAPLVAAF